MAGVSKTVTNLTAGATGVAVVAAAGTIINNIINDLKPQTISSTGDMKFPNDLNDSYFMNLSFYDYSRADLMSIGSLSPLANIRLPIPTNLQDSFGVNYSEEAMTTVIGAGIKEAKGTDWTSLTGAASGIAGLAAAAGLQGLQEAAGKGGAAAEVMSGYSLNPFNVVMFKGPKYKTYSFSWRLFPRNETESGWLLQIVNSIKYYMSPDVSSGFGGALLRWPSLVKCYVYTKGTELYPFKYGVVTDCSFNYAPDGAPSFFKYGQPTAVDVKVNIMEVEYFLKSSMGSS